MWPITAAALLSVTAGTPFSGACNPEPPVPPVLEGHEYDATARDYLFKDARTIAVGKYMGRIDLEIQGESGGGVESPDYIFRLGEGWKSDLPARLVVPGYWIDCDLSLSEGASYLFYLDGTVPMFIVPVEAAREDLETFGDPDWFYTSSGQLVRPDLLPAEAGDDELRDREK